MGWPASLKGSKGASHEPDSALESRDDGHVIIDDDDPAEQAASPPHTPLPKLKVFTIGVILLANTFSMLVVFPYLPWMVSFFYPQLDDKELGFRAGYLGSAFNVGQMFGSIVWGKLADRYGRRPVLLIGIVGTTVSVMLFGFSTNYYLAVFYRFLWGALNGNIGVAKTCLSEITDDSNAALGFSVLGVMSGIGKLTAPALGGELADTDFSWGGIFTDFPFCLPSIVAAVICVLSLGFAYFTLSETLQPRADSQQQPEQPELGGDSVLETSSAEADDPSEGGDEVAASVAHNSESDDDDDGDDDDDDDGDERTSFISRPSATASAASAAPRPASLRARAFSKILRRDSVARRQYATTPYLEVDSGASSAKSRWARRRRGQRVDGAAGGSGGSSGPRGGSQSVWRLLRTKPIFVSVMLYAVIGYLTQIVFEVFPLYVLTKPEIGGFDLTSDQIGLVFMISALPGMFVQLVVFPRVVKRLGFLHTFRYAVLVTGLMVALIPALSVFNGLSVAWRMVIVSTWMTALMSIWMFPFTCVFVLINNSCDPHDKATVNAIAQTLVAATRLLGPIVGGNEFAWSETNGRGWPLNFSFTFWTTGAGYLIAAAISCLHDRSINEKKKEAHVLATPMAATTPDDVPLLEAGSASASTSSESSE